MPYEIEDFVKEAQNLDLSELYKTPMGSSTNNPFKFSRFSYSKTLKTLIY